jgi:HPr kinase/phosphorylase
VALVSSPMTRPLLRRADDHVLVRAPAEIAGLIEVRGVAVVRVDSLDQAPLALVVDLVPSVQVERIPDNRFEVVFGLSIPLMALAPFEVSAAAKLRLVCRAFAVPPPPTIPE